MHLDDLNSTCNVDSQLLHLLSVRHISIFPIDKYRPSISLDLRSFLSYIRALSFRQLRMKCPELKKEVNRLKREAKIQLKNFFSYELSVLVRYRNISSPVANYFWAKSKRFMKPSSSSVCALIFPSGNLVKDSQLMCDVAADFYENFLKKISHHETSSIH